MQLTDLLAHVSMAMYDEPDDDMSYNIRNDMNQFIPHVGGVGIYEASIALLSGTQ